MLSIRSFPGIIQSANMEDRYVHRTPMTKGKNQMGQGRKLIYIKQLLWPECFVRCFTYVFSLNLQGSLMKWELFSLLNREGDLRQANVFIYIYFIYIGILFQKIFQGQNND